MNIHKVWAIIFCFILAGAVFLPMARADEYNQMTKLTFSEAVEIPGHVLPAGTYWFVLQNNNADRNIVRVFNEDWSKLEATVMAIPTYRQQATNETEIKFAERPHKKPEALLKWYYPGLLTGHEFLYSGRHEKEFSRDAKQDVLTTPITLASNAIPQRP
jgi:hypothetical protein